MSGLKSYTTPDGKYTFTNKKDYDEYMDEYYNVSKEDKELQAKRKQEVKDKFTQGVYCDDFPTQYGTFTKVSIQVDKFLTNDTTTKGYINFVIKRSKSGNLYAENVKY